VVSEAEPVITLVKVMAFVYQCHFARCQRIGFSRVKRLMSRMVEGSRQPRRPPRRWIEMHWSGAAGTAAKTSRASQRERQVEKIRD